MKKTLEGGVPSLAEVISSSNQHGSAMSSHMINALFIITYSNMMLTFTH